MEKPNPQSYHETDDARRVKVVIWISWRCSWKPMCRGYGDCVGLFFVHNLNDSWIYTPRLPNTLDLEVWLDPKNILETPSQEVFGSLGYMYMGCNRHHPDFFTFFSREFRNSQKKPSFPLDPKTMKNEGYGFPWLAVDAKKYIPSQKYFHIGQDLLQTTKWKVELCGETDRWNRVGPFKVWTWKTAVAVSFTLEVQDTAGNWLVM